MPESTRVIEFRQRETDLIITDSLLLSFVLLRPRAFALSSSLIDIVATVLGWRVSARDLLRHILKEIGDDETAVELPHEQIGRALWPHLKHSSRKSAVSRALSDLKEDQFLSNFQAVTVISGHIRNKGKGNEEKIPSRYQVDDFYLFAELVSERVGNEELLEKTITDANARFHRIIYDVLAEHKAVKINPLDRKETKRKRKLRDEVMEDEEYRPLTIAERANLGAQKFEAVCLEMAGIISDVSGYPDAKIFRDKLFKLFQVQIDGELESMLVRQKVANAPAAQRGKLLEMEKFKREQQIRSSAGETQEANGGRDTFSGGDSGTVNRSDTQDNRRDRGTPSVGLSGQRKPWEPGISEDGTVFPF